MYIVLLPSRIFHPHKDVKVSSEGPPPSVASVDNLKSLVIAAYSNPDLYGTVYTVLFNNTKHVYIQFTEHTFNFTALIILILYYIIYTVYCTYIVHLT